MALQKRIAELVVSLVIIAVLLPIGIGLISVMGEMTVSFTNASGAQVVPLSRIVDPTVLLLLTTLIPIIVAISIGMYFLEKKL